MTSVFRRLCVFVLGVAAVLLASPVAASDEARCVQQMLTDAHYDVGTIDGQVGARTRRAAEALVSEYPELGLPEFTAANYATWCSAAGAQPFKDVLAKRAPLALVAWRDLEGPTAFWRAHEGANVCQTAQRGRSFDPLDAELPPFDPAIVTRLKPIFPSAAGSPACATPGFFATRGSPPRPVIDAEITSDYHGCDYCKFESTYRYLGPAIAAYRAAPGAQTAASLQRFLIEWAGANALSERIWATWEPHPIDYNVLKIIPPMIIAYSEVGPSMAPADAEMVGRWLHRLVGETLKSRWGDRQDNKSYMRHYVGLLWGLLIDDADLRRVAYEAFDEALYDLRPDGSPPNDSMRGGSGLHYANRITVMLTALATAAAADGVNLFAREVEGRSLTNSANWVLVTASFPSLNLRYAKVCPDGGDKPGSYDRESPDLAHMSDGQFASWAAAYALSPDAAPATLDLVRQHMRAVADRADIHAGGSLACYAAGILGETASVPNASTD